MRLDGVSECIEFLFGRAFGSNASYIAIGNSILIFFDTCYKSVKDNRLTQILTSWGLLHDTMRN